MFRFPERHFLLLVAALLLPFVGGCATFGNLFGNSCLDPSGQGLFSRNSSNNGSAEPVNNPFLLSSAAPAELPSAYNATTGASPAANAAPLPGISPIVPGTGATSSGMFSTATAGSGLDTHSGRTAFVSSSSLSSNESFGTLPVGSVAVATGPINGPALLLTPNEQIAPVDSEVILVGTYLGPDQFLRTHQKVEWNLDGVGTILDFSASNWGDFLHGQFQGASKKTERFAETITSRNNQSLDRGTPDPKDDITILSGQTWISVKSAKEGTTAVTALAPSVLDWQKRTDTSKIHWIDVHWMMPRATLTPAGEQRTLTTIVQRKTNASPRQNWIVQYELLSGPKGGFGQSLAQIVEVPTNSAGQANVDLSLTQLQSGTNMIAVRIFRPDGIDGGESKLLVGQEIIRQTWTTSGMFDARITRIDGKSEAVVGENIQYQWTLFNASDAPSGATVTLSVPGSMSFVSSDSPPRIVGNNLIWTISSVPARARVSQNFTMKAESRTSNAEMIISVVPGEPAAGRPIPQPNPAPVRPSQPLPPKNPDTPVIKDVPKPPVVQPSGPPIQISMSSPSSVRVGEKPRVKMTVKNVSDKTLSNVQLQMQKPVSPSAIGSPLESIMATPGYVLDEKDDSILLAVGNLFSGAEKTLIVEFEALMPASDVKIIGKVTSDGKEIPAPGGEHRIRIIQ